MLEELFKHSYISICILYFHLQGIILPYKVVNGSKNTSAVCMKCGGLYNDLNILYEHLEDEFKGAVCMDLVDTVSTTYFKYVYFLFKYV